MIGIFIAFATRIDKRNNRFEFSVRSAFVGMLLLSTLFPTLLTNTKNLFIIDSIRRVDMDCYMNYGRGSVVQEPNITPNSQLLRAFMAANGSDRITMPPIVDWRYDKRLWHLQYARSLFHRQVYAESFAELVSANANDIFDVAGYSAIYVRESCRLINWMLREMIIDQQDPDTQIIKIALHEGKSDEVRASITAIVPFVPKDTFLWWKLKVFWAKSLWLDGKKADAYAIIVEIPQKFSTLYALGMELLGNP